MMKFKLNDTYIELEMSSYDEHLYGEHVHHLKQVPYCVAHISLKSDERFEPLRDELVAFVRVYLVNGIEPALDFTVVEYDVDNVSSNNVTGGYSHEKIDELLSDLSDGIRYHEINPLYV